MVGRATVRYGLEGYDDQMVTLVREPSDTYTCTTGLAPLEDAAGRVKTMPPAYLDSANYFVATEFLDYVKPLIGPPLPRFGRLR